MSSRNTALRSIVFFAPEYAALIMSLLCLCGCSGRCGLSVEVVEGSVVTEQCDVVC